MLGISNIMLRDYHFYWCISAMSRCLGRDGTGWEAYGTFPVLVDRDGHPMDQDNLMDRTLEELADMDIMFELASFTPRGAKRGRGRMVVPTDLFTSKDWLMFTPPLGYVDVGGQLGLYQVSVPRRRNRGVA